MLLESKLSSGSALSERNEKKKLQICVEAFIIDEGGEETGSLCNGIELSCLLINKQASSDG